MRGPEKPQHHLFEAPNRPRPATALDTTGMKRSMSETIKDADRLTWMVGGVDLSLNDDTQKNGTSPGSRSSMPSLMPILTLSKVLRDTFRPDKIARRPVQIKECDG